MSLTIEQIRAACEQAGETCQVDVPEWSGPVHVRLIRGSEFPALQAAIEKAEKEPIQAFAEISLLCLSDDNGTQALADLDVLLKAPVRVLRRIAEAALEHNGLGEGDEDEGEAKNP